MPSSCWILETQIIPQIPNFITTNNNDDDDELRRSGIPLGPNLHHKPQWTDQKHDSYV